MKFRYPVTLLTVGGLMAFSAGAFAAEQFSDVSDDHQLSEEISWAAENNIAEPPDGWRRAQAVLIF